jgi:hypothetical protein
MAVYELVRPPILPTGTYSAEVVSAEEVESPYGKQVRFQFKVVFDGETHVISAWCNAVYTPRSKLAKWTQALLGKMPNRLDLADFKGARCTLIVQEGERYSRVTDVLRHKSAKEEPDFDFE